MNEWLAIIAALLTTGAVAGVLAGLLGVGGGIVIVPVLYFVFQWLGVGESSAMLIATGTSLLTIVATSMSSIRSHYRSGNVDLSLVKSWWPFIVLGVAFGVYFATFAGGRASAFIFGAVSLLSAVNMLLRANAPALLGGLPARTWQYLVAITVGFISSIMGIGGGTIGVPALSAFNFPGHRAVGTAAVFGFVVALPGALLMLLLGTTPADAPSGTIGLVNLYGAFIIVPMTVITAPAGVRLGSRLSSATLKRLFALFLLLAGFKMLSQSLL